MSARLIVPVFCGAVLTALPAFAAPAFTPEMWPHGMNMLNDELRDSDEAQALKDTNPLAAQRCSELRHDFDRTIAENRSSPKAVNARIAAEDGGQLCATGLYDQGLKKLQAAIDEVSKPVG